MINEFRKDIVSGEWVLIAPGRAKRPDAHEVQRHWQDSHQTIEECPFEDVANMGEVLLAGSMVIVVHNKYPALQPGSCGEPTQHGPFLVQAAHGFHELVITRDHERHMADFTVDEVAEILSAYKTRYEIIAQDDCGDYISIFHNYRREAGASVWHNHSQIISTPVIPPEVRRSLHGADDYFKEHQRTVHCQLIEWELAEKKRIVFTNDHFVVFCPFVSKTPYEMRIFPRIHSPRFELMSLDEVHACAQALSVTLRAVRDALDDVPFNFYIHTAPVQKDPTANYDYYHWHIEIVPKIKTDAGFELGTGLALNSVDPDDAAEKLRSVL